MTSALVNSLLPGFVDLFAFGMLAAYLLVWIRLRAAAARRYAFTVLVVASLVALLMMFQWALQRAL